MSVQRRPLTGMISSGVSAPRAIDNVAATTVHTVDQTTAPGGPFIDDVTLVVENSTAGAIVVTVVALGGASIVQSIPAYTAVTVLDNTPFQTSASGGALIKAQGASAGLVFWGWFARPT